MPGRLSLPTKAISLATWYLMATLISLFVKTMLDPLTQPLPPILRLPLPPRKNRTQHPSHHQNHHHEINPSPAHLSSAPFQHLRINHLKRVGGKKPQSSVGVSQHL